MNKTILKILEFDKITAMVANECGSSLAKAKAERLTPAESLSEAAERLSWTAEALRVLNDSMPPLGGIHDVRPAVKRAMLGAVLEISDFVTLRDTLYAISGVKRFFKGLDSFIECPNLRERANLLEPHVQLSAGLNAAISDAGELKDDASQDLLRIRRSIVKGEQRIKDILQAILRDGEKQKIFRDNIVSMRGDRYVLPVRQEYRRLLPGLVHDQSASGSTVFIEPLAVVEAGNAIKELKLEEKREIERIMASLSRLTARDAETLLSDLETLAFVDFSFGCAKFARKLNATEPELNDGGVVDIIAARHPLIDAKTVVPVDIKLGESYRLLLVTGPNTGGKTVAIKTLGLLALMAQSGLFIPAGHGSKISIYREIFADIGDEQSIEQSLSTFSAHMKHIVYILKKATAEDLVLLDELGAGTDPEEGAALAIAVLKELLSRNASIIATTHYSELKVFAYRTAGVENACVEFDVTTLRPTYRLLIGLPGASNAFKISRRLGLPRRIVEAAGELLDKEHTHFEEIVSALEKKRRYFEEKNNELAAKERALKENEKEIARREAATRAKKDEIIKAAKAESAALLKQARAEADAVIKSLKEQFNDQGIKKRQQAIEDARRRLREAGAETDGLEARPLAAYDKAVDTEKIAVGATVYVPLLGQKATVTKIKGDTLTVEVGSVKTSVTAADCRFVKGPDTADDDKADGRTAGEIYFAKARQARSELDIRGALVAEGIDEVNKFLDDAQVAGLKQVTIIHGKGTGQLRQGIHEHLSGHRAVAAFTFANADEGGAGATVVKLK